MGPSRQSLTIPTAPTWDSLLASSLPPSPPGLSCPFGLPQPGWGPGRPRLRSPGLAWGSMMLCPLNLLFPGRGSFSQGLVDMPPCLGSFPCLSSIQHPHDTLIPVPSPVVGERVSACFLRSQGPWPHLPDPLGWWWGVGVGPSVLMLSPSLATFHKYLVTWI